MRPVAYYVHHAGAGHGMLGAALSQVVDLVGFGSGGRPPGWRGGWIDLPPDDGPPRPADPTRGGAWHWVPPGHPGHAARMRTLAAWVGEHSPAALISDVSCEVAALGTLLGVPTVAVVLPGRRDDRPHRTAWDGADALVAPWPAAASWLDPWRPVLAPIGFTSRFDGRPAAPPPSDRAVLVLLPAGAHDIDRAAVEAAACATPGWRWTVAGEAGGTSAPSGASIPPGSGSVRWVGRVADPWPLLAEARVVVAAAGLGSVAEIAAARRPAVLLPQDRPFDEQRALAATLADTSAPVAVADRWPAADGWPALLDRVAALDPTGWGPLHDGRGVDRFAAVLARVSAGEGRESGRGCHTSPLSPAPSGPSPTAPVPL